MWRLVLLGLAVACSRPAPSQPRPIDRLETAISERDYPAAYDLMPQEFRWVYSRQDFVRMMAGEVITPGPPAPPSKPAVAAFTNATPREALQSLVRAWKAKRWDVILGLVPDRYRAMLSAEKIGKQLEEQEQRETLLLLTRSLNNPIEENGDRARMTYGDAREVQFVHEPDGWKIEDLD